MRRSDREVTGLEDIEAIIAKCKVCRLGLLDGKEVYIVPLNFGYTFNGAQLSLYFHSAQAGRKLDLLRQNNNVCFEMDGAHKLIAAIEACRHSYEYESVIGNGTAEFIQADADKITALKIIMRHQTGREFDFDTGAAANIEIFKISSTSFTAKKRAPLVI
ncbi:MAG: pyridoxamine 5'-phosphate oxidase family protein [Sporomusaceae bacterium]|jgi:nitroimidazol reductase NimA-like FMN-containing flavoprotein (pyridoxamine 5'-phosphate oxidase superfamily)|nr:pyridoxamine 5'-phosphate oxidase family protein [Sporomusaceae bacterium]